MRTICWVLHGCGAALPPLLQAAQNVRKGAARTIVDVQWRTGPDLSFSGPSIHRQTRIARLHVRRACRVGLGTMATVEDVSGRAVKLATTLIHQACSCGAGFKWRACECVQQAFVCSWYRRKDVKGSATEALSVCVGLSNVPAAAAVMNVRMTFTCRVLCGAELARLRCSGAAMRR
jgi:hypothetical protein